MVIWEEHSLPGNPKTFVDIAKELGQVDSVIYHDLTNEQILNWREHVYG